MKRKTEFVLSLIGNILASIIWFVMLLLMIVVCLIPAPDTYGSHLIPVFLITVNMITAAALVFTWIGAFMLSGNQLWWAIYTIMIGGVFIFSPYVVPGILFIIGGSISVAHYQPGDGRPS
ncbi:hypothetical protein [Sporolactobacillus pectinivorans]|uniref:hypothetical protein n=1 Tax=Sporolactobacillus pectinivorans TaxID=1591408 RepID=UPI000C257F0D|nr:hypothetical protein [Sporolactobacillus pectinivorans]